MEKKLCSRLCLLFFLFSVILALGLAGFSEACTKTTDDYAVEIALEKPGIVYNPDALAEAHNLQIGGNDYIYRSHYNQDIAVIVSRTQQVITLQYPTKSIKREIPYFKLSSNSLFYNLEVNQTESIVQNWKQECTGETEPSKCVFEKENTLITVNKIAGKKYSVAAEIIGENISSCSSKEYCPGNCVYYSGKGNCIPLIIVHDIENLLVKTNTIKNFEELTRNMKIEKKVNEVYDIEPENSDSAFGLINWKDAVAKELVWLRVNGVINIGLEDINNISQLSEAGRAGNSRIVFAKDKNNEEKWLHYNDSSSPVLNKMPNCNEFLGSLMPTGMITFEPKTTLYYTIPIGITSLVFLLFIITLIITRVRIKRQKRLKPVTTLYRAEE